MLRFKIIDTPDLINSVDLYRKILPAQEFKTIFGNPRTLIHDIESRFYYGEYYHLSHLPMGHVSRLELKEGKERHAHGYRPEPYLFTILTR